MDTEKLVTVSAHSLRHENRGGEIARHIGDALGDMIPDDCSVCLSISVTELARTGDARKFLVAVRRK